MRGHQLRRRLAYVLRYTGLAIMAGSFVAAGLRSNVPAALAAPLQSAGSLAEALAVADSPVTATPAPAPTSTPLVAAAGTAPDQHASRGGPLTFGVSGNLAFGERMQQSTFGGGQTGSAAQNQADENAGLLLELQRRTGSTMTAVNLPVGVTSLGPTRIGQIQATYATPKLGLTYQAQPLGLLGQVPLGATALGFGLILPIASGDVTTFEGPVTIEDGLMARLFGVRARRTSGSSIFEAGVMDARSETSPENTGLALLGFSHASGPVDETLEAALEHRSNAPDGEPSFASAYQFRSDFGSQQTYGTITVRHQGDGFVALGSGAVAGDDLGDLSLRKNIAATQLTLEEALERSGDGTGQVTSRREAFTLNSEAKGVDYTFALQDQHQVQVGAGPEWTGSVGAQVQAQLFHITTLLQGQEQRVTGTAPGSNAQYGMTLQRQFGQYALLYNGQVYNSTAQGSNSVILTNGVSGTAQIGTRNSIGLSTTFTHTRTPASDALQIAPVMTFNRAISPALTVGVNLGEQFTHDPRNPSADGHSRIFNIQINAPFAFGSSAVAGQPNPHLPATISGSVISVVGATNFVAAAASSNGLSNIEVVLDNSQVQRTDLMGHFQFNFVSPGRHDVRVETASLPRGVTADQPYASVDVLGGQSAQVVFQIGSFGGIQGHVFGRSPDGSLYPISGAQVQLDQITSVTTSSLGAFGFGRLAPGKHSVALVLTSLPANATFPESDAVKTVVVQNGSYADADFTASPLGSIAGRLVYDPLLGSEYGNQGVNNAYVVAEPGEHAAITNDDGTFLLDDLPAGTYTVDVDPETLDDGLGNSTPAFTVDLQPGEHHDGLQFTIGKEQKKVVFSFRATEDADSAQMQLLHDRLPPGGETQVVVTSDETAASVAAMAFGETQDLTYSHAAGHWQGEIVVPGTLKPGTYKVSAIIKGKKKLFASAMVYVDPDAPAGFFQLTPAHPIKGQYTVVRARLLVDATKGDRIVWQDGQTTVLPQESAPHIFVFTVKISEQPLHGLLLTREAKVPITLR